MFRFPFEHSELSQRLDQLNMLNPEKFKLVLEVGQSILKAVEEEDGAGIMATIVFTYQDLMPYLRLYVEEAFQTAVLLRNLQTVTYFLERGLSLQYYDDCLLSLVYSLEYLADDPPIELLQVLLKHGAEVDCSEERHRRTPLHLSCKYNSPAFVKILVEHGADVNAIDNKKNTPLFYAQQNGNKAIAQILQAKGAVVDWKADLERKRLEQQA